jgi:hypothetical protein
MLRAAKSLCALGDTPTVDMLCTAIGDLNKLAHMMGPVSAAGAKHVDGLLSSLYADALKAGVTNAGAMPATINADARFNNHFLSIAHAFQLLCVWCGKVVASTELAYNTPTHAAWETYGTMRADLGPRARLSAMWMLTACPSLNEITDVPEKWAAQVAVLHAATLRALAGMRDPGLTVC